MWTISENVQNLKPVQCRIRFRFYRFSVILQQIKTIKWILSTKFALKTVFAKFNGFASSSTPQGRLKCCERILLLNTLFVYKIMSGYSAIGLTILLHKDALKLHYLFTK